VRVVGAVTSEVNAGMWLPAERFAVGGMHSESLLQLRLPEPLCKNKTAGLITLEGSEADGR
jgi:hypothetical protein